MINCVETGSDRDAPVERDFVASVVGDIDDHRVTFIDLHRGTWVLPIHSRHVRRLTIPSHAGGLNLHAWIARERAVSSKP